MKKIFLFVFLFGLPLVGDGQSFSHEFGFRSDNDAYLAYGQDRYYTNGLFISFRQAMHAAPGARAIKKTWEASVGQYIYNAQSGYVSSRSSVDRPFAGYLYAGGKRSWFYPNDDVVSVSAQAGMIGPASLAEDTQKKLHQIIGFYEVNGWKYQVKNEFQVNLEADYLHLLARASDNSVDLSFQAKGKAGTTFSGAGAGVMVRLGNVNPFSSSAATDARVSRDETPPPNEFYFFYRPEISAVIYDATIQGGMFRKDKGPVTFTPRRILVTHEVGFQFAKKRWTVDFSAILLNKPIKTMAETEQYGSAALYYRFN